MVTPSASVSLAHQVGSRWTWWWGASGKYAVADRPSTARRVPARHRAVMSPRVVV
jgi:DNA-binding IclR family transcriptional regulator